MLFERDDNNSTKMFTMASRHFRRLLGQLDAAPTMGAFQFISTEVSLSEALQDLAC